MPPLDVKTVVEVPLASVELGLDVAVAELDVPEELSLAPVLVVVPCDGEAVPEAGEELGKWPTKN